MQVRTLSPIGGVEVEGIDLGGSRSPDEDCRLRELLDAHGLVVFRGQKLTKQQLVAAGDPFGGAMIMREGVAPDPEVPGISVLSNRGVLGDVMPDDPDELIGQAGWHIDGGYLPAPTRGKILYAVEIPQEGGMTGFIDMASAYADLPEELKARIENLHVVHTWYRANIHTGAKTKYRIKGDEHLARDRFKDVIYPMVRRHPVTGVKVLNCPPLWADSIVELPEAEGKALIQEVIAQITRPEAQYWHAYKPGDAVMWDNWRFIHAASGTIGRYPRTVWVMALKSGPALGRLVETEMS